MPATFPSLFSTDEDVRAFCAALPTRALGRSLHFTPRTASTNDLALAAARRGAPHGAVFAADAQDAGRGRRGRPWLSPPARGLLFSVLLRTGALQPAALGWLPLLAGLACRDAIAAQGFPAPQLKWPNDLVCPFPPSSLALHKLGGILCESILHAGPPQDGCVVAGIGINVNHAPHELPSLPKWPPLSLAMLAGRPASRTALLAAILSSLEEHFAALAEKGPEPLREQVTTALRQAWPPWKHITLLSGQDPRPVEGRFHGLDPFGRLLLQLPTGRIETFADAEIVDVR